jgi:hypothetical protein
MKAGHTQSKLLRPEATDTVTILSTAPEKSATKRFSQATADSAIVVEQYDAGYWFLAHPPIAIGNIEELSTVLSIIQDQPRMLIIRGAPETEDMIGNWVTRTGSKDAERFEGNFRTPAVGRCYIEIDIDKYKLPDDLTLNQESIAEIFEHLAHQLPVEFHDASYHWQLSSSAGVFDRASVSAHLWFWLDDPVPDADLKAWAKHVNEGAGSELVDSALFQHVQAHYTAAPIFVGMPDPFPIRSGLIRKHSDSVRMRLPEPQTSIRATSAIASPATNLNATHGFDQHVAMIGDHPGGDGFRKPLMKAAASYVATNGRDDTDPDGLFDVLSQAVMSADSRHHDSAEVRERASRDFIMPLIESAIGKYGAAAASRRKTRRITDAPAYYSGDVEDADSIRASILALIARRSPS